MYLSKGIPVLLCRTILFLAAVAAFLGCPRRVETSFQDGESRSSCPHGQDDVSVVTLDASNLVAYVTLGQIPDHIYFSDLKKKLDKLSPDERERMFDAVSSMLRNPRLRDHPLSARENSLDAYLAIVNRITFVFIGKIRNPEIVWKFLLKTFYVFDSERKIVSSESYDPHDPPMGLTRRRMDYLSDLDTKLFYAVRRCFEGEPFSSFLRTLPEEKRRCWIDEVETIAKRKVCLFDPGNPNQAMPRLPFRPSPYLPQKCQEKIKAMYREVLQKAGATQDQM